MAMGKKKVKIPLCHPDRAYYCKGMCRRCYEKQLITNNQDYHKRQNKNSRDWRSKNKDRVAQLNKKHRMKYGPQTDIRYFNSIKKKFGLLREDYANLVSKTNNTCYLCGRSPYGKKRLHLDHDHKTNHVRGLLCSRCNWYLHTVEKDINILDRIKTYLCQQEDTIKGKQDTN